MATKLKSYSTTPGSNNSAPPDGWPEGMLPSAVNNSAREMMARLAEWYQDAEWILRNDTVTGFTGTTLVITGDVTARYTADRAIRLDESNSKLGIITTSSYSNPSTTVTITGYTILATPTAIELGVIDSSKNAVVTIRGSQTVQGDKTFSGSTTFTGNVTASGATFQGGSPLVFEGVTADASETTLAVSDPTADRTVTIPDSSGTLPLVLAASSTAVTAPADTAENTLATINLGAGAIGLGGTVSLKIALTCNNNANAKTIRVRFSGASGTVYLSQDIASSTGLLTKVLISNRGATNSQVGYVDAPAGTPSPTLVTSSVDTTAATSIVITAQKGTAGDTVTLEHYDAILYRA